MDYIESSFYLREFAICDQVSLPRDAVRNAKVVDARARNMSHNVRCTKCGNQSIEDSQADIAILGRKVTLFVSSFLLVAYGCVYRRINE